MRYIITQLFIYEDEAFEIPDHWKIIGVRESRSLKRDGWVVTVIKPAPMY